MLPVGQKRQNESLDQDVDSDDSESKPAKRNGRRKIKIEYIEDKNRRHITFSKRKAGIMKKAYELSTLTGTQVLLLVVSETGLVYTFTTTKLQPIVTKPEGKNLIQACLNTPDPSIPDINADSKLEEGGYMPRSSATNDTASASNASPVPVVNRVPEDTSQSQLSPQTASSHSPMMQPAPTNIMRQQQPNMIVPPPLNNVHTTQQHPTSGPVNYSQQHHQQQQHHHHNPQPPNQIGSGAGMPPYNQQRYPPPPPHSGGYNGNLPQPNQPYSAQHNHHQTQQPQYSGNGPQQPYYQQQHHHQQQQQHPSQQQQNAPTGPPPLGYWSIGDQQSQQGGNGQPPPHHHHQQQQPQARQNMKSDRP